MALSQSLQKGMTASKNIFLKELSDPSFSLAESLKVIGERMNGLLLPNEAQNTQMFWYDLMMDKTEFDPFESSDPQTLNEATEKMNEYINELFDNIKEITEKETIQSEFQSKLDQICQKTAYFSKKLLVAQFIEHITSKNDRSFFSEDSGIQISIELDKSLFTTVHDFLKPKMINFVSDDDKLLNNLSNLAKEKLDDISDDLESNFHSQLVKLAELFVNCQIQVEDELKLAISNNFRSRERLSDGAIEKFKFFFGMFFEKVSDRSMSIRRLSLGYFEGMGLINLKDLTETEIGTKIFLQELQYYFTLMSKAVSEKETFQMLQNFIYTTVGINVSTDIKKNLSEQVFKDMLEEFSAPSDQIFDNMTSLQCFDIIAYSTWGEDTHYTNQLKEFFTNKALPNLSQILSLGDLWSFNHVTKITFLFLSYNPEEMGIYRSLYDSLLLWIQEAVNFPKENMWPYEFNTYLDGLIEKINNNQISGSLKRRENLQKGILEFYYAIKLHTIAFRLENQEDEENTIYMKDVTKTQMGLDAFEHFQESLNELLNNESENSFDSKDEKTDYFGSSEYIAWENYATEHLEKQKEEKLNEDENKEIDINEEEEIFAGPEHLRIIEEVPVNKLFRFNYSHEVIKSKNDEERKKIKKVRGDINEAEFKDIEFDTPLIDHEKNQKLDEEIDKLPQVDLHEEEKDINKNEIETIIPNKLPENIQPNEILDNIEKSPKKYKLNESPIKETIEESPIKDVIEESPKKEVTEESPKKEVIEESPIKDVIEESPIKDIIAKSLIKDIIEKSPKKKVIEESPIKDTIEESPIKDIIEESPIKDVIEETPIKDEIDESPIKSDIKVSPIKNEIDASLIKQNPDGILDDISNLSPQKKRSDENPIYDEIIEDEESNKKNVTPQKDETPKKKEIEEEISKDDVSNKINDTLPIDDLEDDSESSSSSDKKEDEPEIQDLENVIHSIDGKLSPEEENAIRKAGDLVDYVQRIERVEDPVTGDITEYVYVQVVPKDSDCYDSIYA